MKDQLGNIKDRKKVTYCIKYLLDLYHTKKLNYQLLLNGFVQICLVVNQGNILFQFIRLSDWCFIYQTEPIRYSEGIEHAIADSFYQRLDKYQSNIVRCKECFHISLPNEEYCHYCMLQVSEHHEICPICLDEKRVREKWFITPCFHIFHRNCLETSLQTKESCPLCRQECSLKELKIF